MSFEKLGPWLLWGCIIALRYRAQVKGNVKERLRMKRVRRLKTVIKQFCGRGPAGNICDPCGEICLVSEPHVTYRSNA